MPVVTADGTPAVLKLTDPDDVDTRLEYAALQHFAGDGAVLLLDAEPALGAMLLERLSPGAALGHVPGTVEEAIEIVCGLLRRLWRPPPAGHGFPVATNLVERWTREFPRAHQATGRPFEPALLGAALIACAELRQPVDEPVLGNRDVHQSNVLAAQREPWLLIDPQPVVAEPAFDLAYFLGDLMPERPTHDDVERRSQELASVTGTQADRICAWALARLVENIFRGVCAGQTWWSRDLAIARRVAAVLSS